MRIFALFLFLVICLSSVSAQEIPSANSDALKVVKFRWFKDSKLSKFSSGETMPADADINKPIFQGSTRVSVKEFFIYEAKFENASGKKIRGFVWQYVFFNADKTSELKRYDFF